MKKLSICMLLCLSVAGCSTAPNITPHTWTEVSPDFRSPIRKRVVIFPLFGDLSGAVTDALATEFLAMGYSVVERTKVNAILKEMKLNPNEKIDITREKEVARATNADAMLIGSSKATISGGIYFINLRFVDVASGKSQNHC